MSSSLEGEFGVELFDCNDEAPLVSLNMLSVLNTSGAHLK
jgi:hypothetical protein